jgi:hypothetical protein
MSSRRKFLADVGKGMFLTTLGAGLAADLGLGAAWAGDEPGSLTFGDLEPLVEFIRETPPDKLLPRAVEKVRGGTDLRQFVAAAALANARAFGGEDYVGFHTLMALVPAYQMSAEEKDEAHRPLAVLKVLVRNATRLQEFGATKETLKPVTPTGGHLPPPEQLREASRRKDLEGAETTFAALARSPADALNSLMYMVDDGAEVHRVVLVSRSWDLLDFVGRDKAHTLLRQSVHYCVKAENGSAKYDAALRELLPKMLDRAAGSARGRSADDAWVAKLADTIFAATPANAAEAVAMACAEGFDPEAIGEAISLAANQLLLRDEGRPKEWASPAKPVGSVHGDSIGVHACDSVQAWRNIARHGDQRTRASSLILAGYQVARDRGARGEFVKWEPYPRAEHLEAVRDVAAGSLLKELDAAIRAKDQPRAAALAYRLGEQKADPAAVFALLRRYAVSEDGALHAEKYYGTTSWEFAHSRAPFKWRQLVALARVTASAYGTTAPGYKEACGLLKV